jgi:hypothetical protein
MVSYRQGHRVTAHIVSYVMLLTACTMDSTDPGFRVQTESGPGSAPPTSVPPPLGSLEGARGFASTYTPPVAWRAECTYIIERTSTFGRDTIYLMYFYLDRLDAYREETSGRNAGRSPAPRWFGVTVEDIFGNRVWGSRVSGWPWMVSDKAGYPTVNSANVGPWTGAWLMWGGGNRPGFVDDWLNSWSQWAPNLYFRNGLNYVAWASGSTLVQHPIWFRWDDPPGPNFYYAVAEFWWEPNLNADRPKWTSQKDTLPAHCFTP